MSLSDGFGYLKQGLVTGLGTNILTFFPDFFMFNGQKG